MAARIDIAKPRSSTMLVVVGFCVHAAGEVS